MKLSSRERIGLRAMVALARHYGDGPVALSLVAREEGLPLPYLEHIVAALRRAGLLHSVRGARGGYALARQPAAINVRAILGAVEDTLLTLDCMGTDGSVCTREPTCAAHSFWQVLAWRLNETLERTSLADILPREQA